MPEEITAYMDGHGWGIHLALWHSARLWDWLTDDARNFVTRHGTGRAARQEGTPGSGLDFLAIHRVMIRVLKQEFPQHIDLFSGWRRVPVDPDDPNDPVPQPRELAIRAPMLEAIDVLENQIDSFPFTDDDHFGLFVQTRLRPTGDRRRRETDDLRCGLHNYLHIRFDDPESDIRMASFNVNLNNQRFWRLHGWIDTRWQVYRDAKRLPETDPVYSAALREQWEFMTHPAHPHSYARAVGGTAEGPPVIPEDIRSLFSVVHAR